MAHSTQHCGGSRAAIEVGLFKTLAIPSISSVLHQ